ncbi:hypothetical protein MSSIH_2731 [Methanosarcina siciliae HI350]|uniref:Uncharacterized protein n=1 Tax=Methanosarcina siciliae HI350 TaxID=1434119 RepID=A0A0E3LBA3_9EURY|nr:hypothetical protein MSSIH_2731 [Methanosarcina siciliae HI350]
MTIFLISNSIVPFKTRFKEVVFEFWDQLRNNKLNKCPLVQGNTSRNPENRLSIREKIKERRYWNLAVRK